MFIFHLGRRIKSFELLCISIKIENSLTFLVMR